MKTLQYVLPLLLLLLALPDMDAQRGQRPSSRTKSKRSRTAQKQSSAFKDRLWYGAGGVLGLSGNQDLSTAAIGLIPQVGYKFTNWLSAGPRLGVTWNTIKGTATDGARRRSNTWSYTAGIFGRARIFDFYAQTEVLALSDQFTSVGITNRGQPLLIIDQDTGLPEKQRESDVQWLVGAGYNAGLGSGLSSDIGIFYNVFDNIESNRSPISFRLTLTYNY